MSKLGPAPAIRPSPARWALVGAVVAGALGAIAGLLVGLRAYAPTAWFAVLELGFPGAIAGALIGATTASTVLVTHRLKHS